MEFLKDLNISDETISKISSVNGEVDVYELTTHCTNATKIIKFFREIGINENSISNILIYCTYIFIMDFDDVKESLEKENISEIVNAVNEDFSAIEQYV